MVAVIWRRHHMEYDLISEVMGILRSIPESVPHVQYIEWLRDDVLPWTLPQHHAFIMDWINDRARAFELQDKAAWPRNALELVDASSCIFERYGQHCVGGVEPRLFRTAGCAPGPVGSTRSVSARLAVRGSTK